jgi:hypothetical protein
VRCLCEEQAFFSSCSQPLSLTRSNGPPSPASPSSACTPPTCPRPRTSTAKPSPEVRVAAIGFTTRNVRELEKYLKAHSIKIDQPLRHGSFAVRDPEGHLVYFVQQGPASSKTISPHAASHRIIHTGFMAHDRAAEDAFWRGILGFRPYWYGGRTDNELNYVSSQVPDGTDWIEYMLHSSDAPPPNPHQLGSDFHFSLGIDHMPDFDPDLTRVEYMEFQPSGTTCCSPFIGKHPTETEDH